MAKVAFSTEVVIPAGGAEIPLRIIIDSRGQAWVEAFGLSLTLSRNGKGFSAGFDATDDGTEKVLSPADVLRELGLDDAADVLAAVGSLPVEKLALIQHKEEGAETSFGLALGITPSLDLADLPLVGGLLPKGAYGLGNMTLGWASAALDRDAMGSVAQMFPKGFTLPAAPSLGTALHMGKGRTYYVSTHPAQSDETQNPDKDTPDAKDDKGPLLSFEDGTIWVRIGKSLGPVTLKRAGLRMEEATVSAPFDISFLAGPVRMDLLGAALALTFDPSKPDPETGQPIPSKLRRHFMLDGVAVAYKTPQFSISGALKRRPGKGLRMVGALVIETSSFSIAAVGAYDDLPGQDPSFFVFGVLNKSLGGPPFFRVMGLAAGFGLNRRFVAGPVDQVEHHPLVEFAARKTPLPADKVLEKITPQIDPYLPNAPGAMWFSVGVKGSTFGLIDTFLMLTLVIEDQVSVSALGLSTMVLPPAPPKGSAYVPQKPIARIVLQIKSDFAPDTGQIELLAQIAGGSFVLSPDCHLSGGLAFRTWVKGPHLGDFALTIGGWHHKFTVPDHYPNPPRLALDWQVTRYLAIHGELYFGLTPSCVMAGGALSAIYARGALRASFFLKTDFLMNWEPFHYDWSLEVGIDVSYTAEIPTLFFDPVRVPFRINVSTNVAIWGPPFGGVAKVQTKLKDFAIDFGADPVGPEPVGWHAIREKYLPQTKDFTSIAVTSGLLHQQGEGADVVQILSPKKASLEVRSAVPLTRAKGGQGGKTHHSLSPLGLRPSATPVALAGFGPALGAATASKSSWDAQMDVTVIAQASGQDVTEDFNISPILGNVPAALWSDKQAPKTPTNDIVKGAVTGLKLCAKQTDLSQVGEVVPLSAYAFKELGFPMGWTNAPSDLAAPSKPTAWAPDAQVAAAAANVFHDLVGYSTSDEGFDDLQTLVPQTYRAMPKAAALGAAARPSRGM